MPQPDPGTNRSGEGVAKWLVILKVIAIAAGVWWLSGARVRLIPGVKGTVVVSETKKPLPQAVVHFRLPWRYGIAAKTFLIPAPGGRVIDGGALVSECMTDSEGRFRLGPRMLAFWMWGKEYDSRFSFDYVHHPLFAAERVNDSQPGWRQFFADQTTITVIRLSAFAKRLADGDQGIHQRPGSPSYFTQVSLLMGVSYFLLPGSVGKPQKARENTYRDLTEIKNEWTRTAKVLSMQNELESRLESVRQVLQETGQ